ncbi:PH domain-containing protein [Planomicrobium okeanokoites]|uniref:PH domain-containing protein n=1 Tax=Planomicrobium okeanokoites TaxID=244 RepID=UPI000A03D7D2|nr:PH domain-containing protein [Planomicrobium okeanokoites]
MPSLKEIQEKLKNLDGMSKFFGRREIKELPNILWEDEELLNLVQGMYNTSQGILIATNRRLIFIDKGMFGGLKVEDFPYDKISSIQYSTGIMFGKVTIFTSWNRAEITQIEKAHVRIFAETVRARISGGEKKENKEQFHTAVSAADEIIKYKSLLDAGVLTQEEFDVKKKELLGL